MPKRTCSDLLADIQNLAYEAGDIGHPMLEIGLLCLLRASRQPEDIKSYLCSVSTLQLMALESPNHAHNAQSLSHATQNAYPSVNPK